MSTETQNRETAEASAIEDGPIQIGDYTFRTFTSLSFERCQRMDIRLATAGKDTVDQMDGLSVMRDAAFVGWMQTAPRAEVRTAFSAGDDAVWDAVDEWEEAFNELDDPPWADLIREVARVIVTGKLLMVKLVDTAHAKELKKDGEQPPPN